MCPYAQVPITLIIEEERRKQRERQERPSLQLPIPSRAPCYGEPPQEEPEEPRRGVIIIDLSI